MLLKIVYYLYF